jgi:Raf kinase inhibitor-like YbhB/YbcL family protein
MKNRNKPTFVFCLILSLFSCALFLPGCGNLFDLKVGAPTFVLKSIEFNTGERIPDKFTCQGDNISPYLYWSSVPTGTISFALITEDIDGPSGIITHWIIFNLPSNIKELSQGIPLQGDLSNGAKQGNNIRGGTGYTGPCPPAGTTHRYEFTLFALDKSLDLKPGISRADLISAIQGHIIAIAQTMGYYSR